MLLLEPVDDLLQRGVVLELEAVPKRPLGRVELALLGSDGLGEAEERKGKIDEAVLVVLKLVLAVNDLDKGAKIVKTRQLRDIVRHTL